MSVKRREYRTQRHCLPTAAAGDKGALKEQSELQTLSREIQLQTSFRLVLRGKL